LPRAIRSRSFAESRFVGERAGFFPACSFAEVDRFFGTILDPLRFIQVFYHCGRVRVIAALLHIVPILLIFIPSYVIFYAIFLVTMLGQRGEPNPGSMLAFFGIFFVYWFIMVVIMIVISIAFTFAYPLIVDRGLSGVDAVKLSFRAAMANFWRLLGLSLLSAVLGFAGVILCYVGVFLVIPITLAAVAVAYEQVLGLGEPASNLPPPPPTFN